MLVGTTENSRTKTASGLVCEVVELLDQWGALFPPLNHRHENEERGTSDDARGHLRLLVGEKRVVEPVGENGETKAFEQPPESVVQFNLPTNDQDRGDASPDRMKTHAGDEADNVDFRSGVTVVLGGGKVDSLRDTESNATGQAKGHGVAPTQEPSILGGKQYREHLANLLA